MEACVWLGAGLVLIVTFLAARPVLRSARRKRLRAAPFPPQWHDLLQRNVSLYRHLPEKLKGQLHGDINVFLAEKRFEGCGGLAITDEIRVTVAAEACMLLLNRPRHYFPRLHSVLVYPTAYFARHASPIGGGGYIEEDVPLAGQSWRGGSLVLAWDHVKAGALNGQDGHNVVLHEFAHQLDEENGPADGAPVLDSPARYAAWARVCRKEYEELCRDVKLHRRSVLDAYGATNPAEFFAVATETFFEKPRQLLRHEPDLYAVLKDYYRMDPAEWK